MVLWRFTLPPTFGVWKYIENQSLIWPLPKQPQIILLKVQPPAAGIPTGQTRDLMCSVLKGAYRWSTTGPLTLNSGISRRSIWLTLSWQTSQKSVTMPVRVTCPGWPGQEWWVLARTIPAKRAEARYQTITPSASDFMGSTEHSGSMNSRHKHCGMRSGHDMPCQTFGATVHSLKALHFRRSTREVPEKPCLYLSMHPAVIQIRGREHHATIEMTLERTPLLFFVNNIEAISVLLRGAQLLSFNWFAWIILFLTKCKHLPLLSFGNLHWVQDWQFNGKQIL